VFRFDTDKRFIILFINTIGHGFGDTASFIARHGPLVGGGWW